MNRRNFGFLSSGWIKAIVIALPATVIFGQIALLGFLVGIFDTRRSSTLTDVDWFSGLSGLGGILGLVGLWLRFVFQIRLSRKVSIFNWTVCFLFLSGVGASFGAIWFLLSLGVEFFLKYNFSSLPEVLFSLGLLVCGLYGAYLAITVVIPNHDHEKTR